MDGDSSEDIDVQVRLELVVQGQVQQEDSIDCLTQCPIQLCPMTLDFHEEVEVD